MMVDNWRGFRLRNDKPKGIISGPSPVSGAKYEQGGYFFSSTGECLGEGQNPKPGMFAGSGIVPVCIPTVMEMGDIETDGKINAKDIHYEDLNATIMELSDAGNNANEIHAHLQHNGTDITWQKIASIVRKEKKKRLSE